MLVNPLQNIYQTLASILKMTKQITYIVLIVFTLTNCKNDLMTEEKILSDIFPQLVDSLHISRTNLFPAPPPPIYDNDSNFIGTDTIAAKIILDENKKVLKQIDSVDSRLIIGITDSCFVMNWDDLKDRDYIENELIKKIIEANKYSKTGSKKLDVSQINSGTDYNLIVKSDLEKKYGDIWRIKDRKFGGLIAISRIYFDKDFNLGLLHIETYPFYQEGAGYFIIIERINNKWRIKRILNDWIT